ncbi:unnamed protein product [Ectocarpus sp. 4 AP-2014]
MNFVLGQNVIGLLLRTVTTGNTIQDHTAGSAAKTTKRERSSAPSSRTHPRHNKKHSHKTKRSSTSANFCDMFWFGSLQAWFLAKNLSTMGAGTHPQGERIVLCSIVSLFWGIEGWPACLSLSLSSSVMMKLQILCFSASTDGDLR